MHQYMTHSGHVFAEHVKLCFLRRAVPIKEQLSRVASTCQDYQANSSNDMTRKTNPPLVRSMSDAETIGS